MAEADVQRILHVCAVARGKKGGGCGPLALLHAQESCIKAQHRSGVAEAHVPKVSRAIASRQSTLATKVSQCEEANRQLGLVRRSLSFSVQHGPPFLQPSMA
ncbi:hypothetical protein L1887_56884 [Cichorium endivia]|nr:hypothetical protein L1887_56884 [Cichorium endivia]